MLEKRTFDSDLVGRGESGDQECVIQPPLFERIGPHRWQVTETELNSL